VRDVKMEVCFHAFAAEVTWAPTHQAIFYSRLSSESLEPLIQNKNWEKLKSHKR